MKNIFRKIQLKQLMKNQFESKRLREIFFNEYHVKVGMYSYGCFDLNRIPKGTVIGRYCSFSPTSYIFNANHGMNFLTMHPYTYNTNLGLVEKETIERSPCLIEDDVWVGHHAIITPSVSKIGRGAVIAAGAVVTKDVPRYAVMAGNPAQILKYRFSEEVINEIENSKWWLQDKESLKAMIDSKSAMLFDPQQYFSEKEHETSERI